MTTPLPEMEDGERKNDDGGAKSLRGRLGFCPAAKIHTFIYLSACSRAFLHSREAAAE